jgi:hypothetical protein
VVAGLQNGTVVRLYGNSTGRAIIEWQYNAIGTVYDIVQLNNGSVVVGTSDAVAPYEGHIYCLDRNGHLAWSYNSTSNDPLTPGLVKEFGEVNNDSVPDVVAVFHDGYIRVLNGTTGKEITPWPFNVGNPVTDLLCTQDYTGDGFPDIVTSTQNGSLMIINGRTATLLRGPVQISNFTPSYIQYMYFYENGVAYSNQTLAVSGQGSNGACYVYGLNASDLTPMEQFPVSATALNLFGIGNSTSNFTGNLLFTVANTVYCLQGSDIIVPEFTPNFILVSLVISIWLSILILRKRARTYNSHTEQNI